MVKYLRSLLKRHTVHAVRAPQVTSMAFHPGAGYRFVLRLLHVGNVFFFFLSNLLDCSSQMKDAQTRQSRSHQLSFQDDKSWLITALFTQTENCSR